MVFRATTFLSLSVLLAVSGPLRAEKPAVRPDADRGKALIEAPPKALLVEAARAAAKSKVRVDITKERIEARPKALLVEAARAAPKPRLDKSKREIEAPPKRVLAEAAAAPKRDKQLSPPSVRGERARAVAAGKKVAPGKVRWHSDFKTAVAKSRTSKKPVLLFQLLGQLDEEFT